MQLYAFLGQRVTSLMMGEDFYSHCDVLLVQDGGCAPGYNTVTCFLAQQFESSGFRVFVAQEGFKSLVSGKSEDLGALIYDRELAEVLGSVPRITHASELQNRRGAAFRTERYPAFKEAAKQEQAARNILARHTKVVVGVGGNGTCAGMKALSGKLKEICEAEEGGGTAPQTFFVPVTIDSDIEDTECIGQHTAVHMGAEKIRCFVADAYTHQAS